MAGATKDTSVERPWRAPNTSAKDTTPERSWRAIAAPGKENKEGKDVTPERGWRTGLIRGTTLSDRGLGFRGSGTSSASTASASASNASTSCASLCSKDTTPEHGSRELRPLGRPWTVGGGASPQGLGLRAPVQLSAPRTAPAVVHLSGLPSTIKEDESAIQSLLLKGFLSSVAQPWKAGDMSLVATPDNDLAHVKARFELQVPNTPVHGVYRVENAGLGVVYNAFRSSLGERAERNLWHGTSVESVRNIALNGFNRAYCGRHGMKYGQGTYFSASAGYSMRFCDRRRSRRLMFLAKVIVGKFTKGSSDMVEPPHRDSEGLTRFDSTVDDVESPNIFCVFRDFQAIPLYLVEFSSPPP